ncbi:hypothetical protein BGW36DRAFT_380963 [Talaromyces proteolyticus]|uniref:Uncharacterized protein n=1 Tax=Talaromyces proteolyticus TaxID=1131652 RepID=A0AAD4KPQ9_9EURO|nr:uncharacterized protein BGW36DRAFT_380963 [Talaromyces proteolyticus]KAH8696421.1 hypothetical protein BGW36DRAFT_380963 [Talaromyces proteolyticus]
MVLDNDTLSDTPRDTDTWNNPDPGSPYAALFPNKLERQYLHRPNAFYLYVGFAGPWNWERAVLARLKKHLEGSRQLLRRDPTQAETNAWVELTSREVNVRQLGLPLGISAGLIHASYTIRSKLNMPKQASFFDNVQNAWKQATVMERRSVAFQAGLRLSFWVLFMMGNLQAFAAYRITTAVATDSRLEDFRAAIQRYTKARMQQFETTTEEARRKKREEREATRHQTTATTTGSAEEPPEMDYGRRDRAPVAADSVDFGFDGQEQDAGAFGYEDQTAPKQERPRGGPNGAPPTNAWERIRQQRAGSSGQSTDNMNSISDWRRRAYEQQQQKVQQSQNFGSDYQTEEQARQKERDVAQREFDSMLDAERQLSQDSMDAGDNGSKKSWRR